MEHNKKEYLYFYDTTLRDGAQTRGVNFTNNNKNRLSNIIDDLGIDYIEGGWPGANPNDTEFFNNPPKLNHAKLVAFGMTRKIGNIASDDAGLKLLIDSQTDIACLVAKTWDYHVKFALGITLNDNLDAIKTSIEFMLQHKTECHIDAEHFFDGYKANSDYALQCLITAINAGARFVILCDTNGGSMPYEIANIVTEVAKYIPKDKIGIHCHNDCELAVANSLAAIMAGARHIQGTLNGLGERCGNANLCSIIPTLLLKKPYCDLFTSNITQQHLQKLYYTSHILDEIINLPSSPHLPYIGKSAFAHKGGLHVSAVLKDPKTYEHITPESVGNQRHIPVSDQAGRSNIISKLQSLNIQTDESHIKIILNHVKDMEHRGYSYDIAEASFELLVRRILGILPQFFEIESYKTIVERRTIEGHSALFSEAIVKIIVNGQRMINVGEGNGPVHALDTALRKDLGIYQHKIEDLELEDYKVRILNQGTNAITRVMIDSKDSKGNHWTTIGVSENIVDASFEAITESLIYKLLM